MRCRPCSIRPDWDDALIVTADGGGDNVHYSHRHFADGKLRTIYGGEETILTPAVEDSLGKMYGAATKALGFRRVRHEGKVTGLAAMGKPVAAAELQAKFSVDDNGRVHSTLRSDKEINSFLRALKGNLSKEDYSASVQQVLEDTMLLSFERLLDKHPAKHLGAVGRRVRQCEAEPAAGGEIRSRRGLRLSGDGRRRPAGRRRARLSAAPRRTRDLAQFAARSRSGLSRARLYRLSPTRP